MDKFKATYKYRSFESTQTIYAYDKESAIQKARLLAKPGYRLKQVEQVK